MRKNAIILLPTYKEIDNIKDMLIALKHNSHLYDLLVIDDNSPDGTGLVVQDFMRENSWVTLLTRGSKEGLGAAYKDGILYALGKKYSEVITMDCDFSHDPSVIPVMLESHAGNDLTLGSRYITGGSIENWSPMRRALSKWGNIYYNLMTGAKVKDLTTGFRVYSSKALAGLDIESLGSKGYAFQAEMVMGIKSNKGSIYEFPIKFTDRERGTSKMSLKITIESFLLAHKFLIRRVLKG